MSWLALNNNLDQNDSSNNFKKSEITNKQILDKVVALEMFVTNIALEFECIADLIQSMVVNTHKIIISVNNLTEDIKLSENKIVLQEEMIKGIYNEKIELEVKSKLLINNLSNFKSMISKIREA